MYCHREENKDLLNIVYTINIALSLQHLQLLPHHWYPNTQQDKIKPTKPINEIRRLEHG